MYRSVVRPLLFLISPETVHHLVVSFVQLILSIPGKKFFFNKCFVIQDQRLERELFGLKFKNPIGIAAGFDKHGEFYNELGSFGFSFVEIGTVTPEPQPGNPKPRMFRLPKDQALINRMGINNHGVRQMVEKLKKRPKNVILGGNIGKNTTTPDEKAIEDYSFVFKELYPYVDYITVNLSCPNVGSISCLQEKDFQLRLFTELKRLDAHLGGNKPIFVKIAPEYTEQQLDETIEVVRKTGIAGIVATNTTKERSGLKTDPVKVNQIGPGGLSGKPLRDKSTEVIRYLYEKSGGNIPIIGVGGIISPEDALEKLDAGACLVQLYTGFIYEGPAIAKRINKAILRRSE